MNTDELMARVRRLRIVIGRRVDELFAGEYHSAFRGLGMEFAEVREYQPGDDVRAIDWNVTARTGRPFVKRFQEERELTVVLLADLSGSGRFGVKDRLKQEMIAELCAVLALAAQKNNDKVGLMIFTDRVELHLPPEKGLKHSMRIIREALSFEAKHPGTNIGAALDELAKVQRRRAVVFLISDFLDRGYEQSLRRIAQRHDLVALRVVDPAERILAPSGMILVRDAESGEFRTIDTSSRRARAGFARGASDHERAADALLTRAGVDHGTIVCGEPYITTLINLFRQRERRR